MRTLLLLVVAILPVYLIGLFIYKYDKDKESKKLLSKLFIFGIVSCLPTIILELLIGSFFGVVEGMNFVTLFFYSLFSIAIVEEFCKWFFVYKISYNSYEFDHIYDAIVYCVFTALGFALLENVFYIFDGGIKIAFLRAISAVPGHACFAVVMGNYLGLAKLSYFNSDKNLEKKNLILSVIVPTILHTLYDFCLFTSDIWFFLLFIVVLVFIYIYSIRIIKKKAKITDNFISNNEMFFKFCPKCGCKVIGKYCIKCGTNLSGNINGNSLTH